MTKMQKYIRFQKEVKMKSYFWKNRKVPYWDCKLYAFFILKKDRVLQQHWADFNVEPHAINYPTHSSQCSFKRKVSKARAEYCIAKSLNTVIPYSHWHSGFNFKDYMYQHAKWFGSIFCQDIFWHSLKSQYYFRVTNRNTCYHLKNQLFNDIY